MDERTVSKSTNVARNKRWCPRVQTAAPTCRAARMWRCSAFPAQVTACAVLLSAFWLRATSTIRDRRSLSRAQHTIPSLACSPYKAPVEVRVPQADRQTCRAVSKDRQTLRRILSGLPASKPDSRFVPSVPLSVESPTCRSVQRLSRQTQHGASFVRSFRSDPSTPREPRPFLTHSTPFVPFSFNLWISFSFLCES